MTATNFWRLYFLLLLLACIWACSVIKPKPETELKDCKTYPSGLEKCVIYKDGKIWGYDLKSALQNEHDVCEIHKLY